MSDGRVELQAEGDADAVRSFLDAVAHGMRGYIDDAEVQDQKVEGTETFEIRY